MVQPVWNGISQKLMLSLRIWIDEWKDDFDDLKHIFLEIFRKIRG